MKKESTTPLAVKNEDGIRIRGACTNNLKSIDVDIPYNQMVVISGLSGSGKSSLGFGTLFAEGSRRYIESFSAHARQFLEKINRPPVESIQGILPSIGLGRKSSVGNPRARVGTTTDVYTYMKLLFSRLGVTYSPVSGKAVRRHTIEDVVSEVTACQEGEVLIIMAPLHKNEERSWEETLRIELGKGFVRLIYKGEMVLVEDFLEGKEVDFDGEVYIVIDRFKVAPISEDFTARIADSVKTAFFEGKGLCVIERPGKPKTLFSDRFEADGITFEDPSIHFFSTNSSHGSCRSCQGLGQSWGLDMEKIMPNPTLSLREGLVVPWKNVLYANWQKDFVAKSKISFYRSYKDFTDEEKKLLWKGNEKVEGIYGFFRWLALQNKKVQHRISYTRYHGITTCHGCGGHGLRPEVAHVKISGKNILELLETPIDKLYDFFMKLSLPAHQKKLGKVLIDEIQNRLYYLIKVGLCYLTLSRQTRTLSGGEYQRARLSKILGSPLVESLYVLDEPTSGLHQRDADQLVQALIDLKDARNTVVVVGHEEIMMRAACGIIDIGPGGGEKGGNLLFQGSWDDLVKAKNSYTADYLTGKRTIPLPAARRSFSKHIRVEQVHKNNLKNVDVSFPLGVFTAVSGVSGSGKSTLIDDILHVGLCQHLNKKTVSSQGMIPRIIGDVNVVEEVIYMGQNSLVKSRRSTLATYLDAYDHIRALFASQPLAQERNYTAGYFSFNVPGGRCEECYGEGEVKVDMQFMEDVHLLCEACQGKRFQDDILEVRFSGKNIIEVLDMTVEESLTFFGAYPEITDKLKPLAKLGMEFLRLGQSTKTFSSGEAQRIKLAFYMNTEHIKGHTFFIFDEPSTGLHFHDIKKLIEALHALVAQGHTVLVVEHNMDMIKSADWVIDLGPEGGEAGGHIVFEGTPEEIVALQDNHTAHYLRPKLTAK